MKTGSEFHVGIVGLGSMGMGAALSCVRAGLSTWGADLNSNACATLKEAGACGVSDNAATFAEKLDALLRSEERRVGKECRSEEHTSELQSP